MSSPKYFSIPFCDSGDKTTIPDTPPGNNSINYTTGWTSPYGVPKGDPGSLDVTREPTNQALFDITSAMKLVQESGVLPWRDDVTYQVAAIVMGSDANLYRAVVSNINEDPTTQADSSIWIDISQVNPLAQAWETGTGSSPNVKILTPINGGDHPLVGVWEDGAQLTFRNSGNNTGPVVISILNNPSMQNISVAYGLSPPDTNLLPNTVQTGQYYTVIYRSGLDVFVLENPRAIGVANGTSNLGLTVLQDSISSSSINTAATANAVQLAALNNNFTFSSGNSGYYLDNDNGLLMQWARSSTLTFNTGSSSNTSISWPITFPNNVRSIHVTTQTDSSFAAVASFASQTTSAVTVRYQAISSSGTGRIYMFGVGN